MVKTKARLTREDWAMAALLSLTEQGSAAISVEGTARRLGATKGSFYWHFRDRAELVAAAVEQWEQVATIAVIDAARVEPEPAARLGVVLRAAFGDAEEGRAEHALMRSGDDPLVAPALQRVVAVRLAYLREVFRDLGFPIVQARLRALTAYAAYLGFLQMDALDPTLVPKDRATYGQRLHDLLTAET